MPPTFPGVCIMTWIAPTALAVQILLLLYVAVIDIATRLIQNGICLAVALLGIVSQFPGPHVAESLVVATILFLLLLVVYARGWIGGGDVKLLVALAVGLPLAGLTQMLTVTAFAGAVLALAHLMMRSLPTPPAGPRRVVALAPRLRGGALRHVRRAPLPMEPRSLAAGCAGPLSQGV